MNERELLQLAAKAYGFGLCADGKYTLCWTESDYPRGSKTNGALWNYIGHGDTAQLWNPITDDGDALRLAVKLRVKIGFGPSFPACDSGMSASAEAIDGRDTIYCVESGANKSPRSRILESETQFAEYMQREERGEERWCSDEHAATRLAITRAAAEIGRQMK